MSRKLRWDRNWRSECYIRHTLYPKKIWKRKYRSIKRSWSDLLEKNVTVTLAEWAKTDFINTLNAFDAKITLKMILSSSSLNAFIKSFFAFPSGLFGETVVNVIDIMLILSYGKFQPLKNAKHETTHIHYHSSHPPIIIRLLSNSQLSPVYDPFQSAAPTYNNALNHFINGIK